MVYSYLLGELRYGSHGAGEFVQACLTSIHRIATTLYRNGPKRHTIIIDMLPLKRMVPRVLTAVIRRRFAFNQ